MCSLLSVNKGISLPLYERSVRLQTLELKLSFINVKSRVRFDEACSCLLEEVSKYKELLSDRTKEEIQRHLLNSFEDAMRYVGETNFFVSFRC